MLKKLIIGLYAATAVFLMGFTSGTANTKYAEIQEQDRTEITWEQLANISRSLKMMGNFDNVIRESLHGKKIKMSGYIIPADTKSYVLSKNVFSHCFFCSTAGIETIMGIRFKGKLPRLKTDAYVTLEGTFFYNDKDRDDWPFSIHNAVITFKK